MLTFVSLRIPRGTLRKGWVRSDITPQRKNFLGIFRGGRRYFLEQVSDVEKRERERILVVVVVSGGVPKRSERGNNVGNKEKQVETSLNASERPILLSIPAALLSPRVASCLQNGLECQPSQFRSLFVHFYMITGLLV